MIMLGVFSMTATQSGRNTAPKDTSEMGKSKSLFFFIFGIIKGPQVNWIILGALYTID